MRLNATLAAAEEMEVSPRHAVLLRLRFLQEEIAALKGWKIFYAHVTKVSYSKYKRDAWEVSLALIDQELTPLEDEAKALQEYLNGGHKRKLTFSREEIPADRIERARKHDIMDLVEKPRGSKMMVFCPFHANSRSPAASVKNNVLYCFAGCKPKKPGRKGWDPILLLMERDGKSFPAAVEALQ